MTEWQLEQMCDCHSRWMIFGWGFVVRFTPKKAFGKYARKWYYRSPLSWDKLRGVQQNQESISHTVSEERLAALLKMSRRYRKTSCSKGKRSPVPQATGKSTMRPNLSRNRCCPWHRQQCRGILSSPSLQFFPESQDRAKTSQLYCKVSIYWHLCSLSFLF